MTWLHDLFSAGRQRPTRSLDSLVEEARSWNGHVREEAVLGLALLHDGAALPVLLERVNDWVGPVRDAARRAVLSMLDDRLAEAWAGVLDGVVALGRGRRADHSALLSRIESFLGRPAVLAAIGGRGSGLSLAARRLWLRLQLRCTDAGERDAAVARAIASTDIVAAMMAFSEGGASDAAALVRLVRTARFAALRLAALRRYLALGETPGASVLQAACFDRGNGVRRLALAALAGHGAIRAVVLARAEVDADGASSPRARLVALDVLCMLAPDDAAALCARALDSPEPAVRAFGFARLLSRTAGDERDALVLRALVDASPRVRVLAGRTVHRGAAVPAVDVLLAIRRDSPWARDSVLRIAEQLAPWSALRFALGRLAVPDEADTAALLDDVTMLVRSLRTGYIRPRRLEVAALRECWPAVAPALQRHAGPALCDDAIALMRAVEVLTDEGGPGAA